MIGLVGSTGSAAEVGWIPGLMLWLVVRTLTPHSAVWFGGEDKTLCCWERNRSYLFSSLSESGCLLDFWLLLSVFI